MEKEKNDIKNESENQCSENINALDEICKGACMGMDAIHFILDKLDNEDLKEYLNKDYEKYEKIKNEIEEIYPEYNDGKPHETGPIKLLLMILLVRLLNYYFKVLIWGLLKVEEF